MQTIIIGAGASGMLAALTAAALPGNRVRLLERQARVGRKLAATGNGRCNLTNLNLSRACYHSSTGEDLHALSVFDEKKTLDYFRSLGLVCVSEADGRCYPHSDQATSVVDVLRFAIEHSDIALELGCEVRSAERTRKGFHLSTSTGEFSCDKLIIACGGPASEKLGATADGAKLLRMLGHSVTPLTAGLVQLRADEPSLRALKGVRAPARLVLKKDDQLLATSEGEVQFLEDGVSGPAVFELSREAAMALPCSLTLDLLPQLEEDALQTMLLSRCHALPDRTAEDLFTGMLHNRLGRVCVKRANVELSAPLASLDAAALGRCTRAVKEFSLELVDTYGLAHAQVTIGGANLSQFCPRTLESRLVRGLYACGEVLDVDGACGGYNLQWAWSSGYLAGQLKHEEEAT